MSTPLVVVITGSSAGIGRATAHEFAKRGAKIGLLARGIDALEGAKSEVEALGGEALCCICDVSDPDQIKSATDRVESELGPIDIWINNATATVFSPVDKLTPAEFKHVTEVTYLGVVYGTMEVLRRMRKRGQGKIVFVGSALAYRGIPLQSAYCGAKHAINGFFESLRAELIYEGSDIKMSLVQLPAVNTTQFSLTRNKMPSKSKPMGTIFEPEVAARGIYYAATNDDTEIFVGWSTFQMVWGNKLFPRLFDWMLGKTAYEGQLIDQPNDPDASGNLFEPTPGDHGYRGEFSEEASASSPMLWLTMNKTVGVGLFGLAAIGISALIKRKYFH